MIIGNCGRRVNNLIAKNTEETLLDFWLIAKKKYPNLNWIIKSLLFVLNWNFRVVTKALIHTWYTYACVIYKKKKKMHRQYIKMHAKIKLHRPTKINKQTIKQIKFKPIIQVLSAVVTRSKSWCLLSSVGVSK
jgi:hypothetical protein